MKRWTPLCLVALASLALVASSTTSAGVTASSRHASATATDEQVDQFQREVLAAINCEELALQPGLSDELARSWMLCSLYSLYDALDLAPHVFSGLREELVHRDLHGAVLDDLSALKKHPLAKGEVEGAISVKRSVVRIIHSHAPDPPKPAG